MYNLSNAPLTMGAGIKETWQYTPGQSDNHFLYRQTFFENSFYVQVMQPTINQAAGYLSYCHLSPGGLLYSKYEKRAANRK
jgi:hypothetical protein